jgi:4-hydroxy-tetrahydrodipicolinate synthase
VLSPHQITELHERIPQLVGCKVAAGDKKWFEELGDTARRISVFAPGHHLATHWPMGSSGAYSNVACISPRGAKRWNDLIINDLPAAQAFERRLLAFFDQSITPYITRLGYSNPAVDKLLAAMGGWCDIGTRMRWPYRSIPADHAQALARIARRVLPELAC